MKAAIELAKEILRKKEAIRRTQSEHLKRDYKKSVEADRNELLYYCRQKHLDVGEVFEKAQKIIAN